MGKRWMYVINILSVLLGSITFSSAVMASLTVPTKINVQAIARDNQNKPTSLSYEEVMFSFWTAEMGRDDVCTDELDVTIDQGLMNIVLELEINVFTNNPELCLEIGLNDDLKVSRRQVVSVAYAFHAETAKEAAHAKNADKAGLSEEELSKKCVL